MIRLLRQKVSKDFWSTLPCFCNIVSQKSFETQSLASCHTSSTYSAKEPPLTNDDFNEKELQRPKVLWKAIFRGKRKTGVVIGEKYRVV